MLSNYDGAIIVVIGWGCILLLSIWLKVKWPQFLAATFIAHILSAIMIAVFAMLEYPQYLFETRSISPSPGGLLWWYAVFLELLANPLSFLLIPIIHSRSKCA